MSIRSGVWLYVWSERPATGALDGFSGALVRAANGDGTKSGSSGYDFAASWKAWAAAYPGRCQPWTYLYPSSDGARSARALFGVVGKQPVYQVDLEDAVPPATIRAFCATMRSLAPGAKLIFDSYPSRAQFVRVNGAGSLATWDTAIAEFDALNPQIYWATQAHYDADRDGIPDYVDDAKGKPVLPAISVSGDNTLRPASWPDVLSSGAAQRLLDRFGTLALWRYPDTAAWRGKLTTPSTQEDDMDAAQDAKLTAIDAGVRSLLGQFDPARTNSLVDKLNRTGSRLADVQTALLDGIADDEDRDARLYGRLDALDLDLSPEDTAQLAAALDLDEDRVAAAVQRRLADALTAGPAA